MALHLGSPVEILVLLLLCPLALRVFIFLASSAREQRRCHWLVAAGNSVVAWVAVAVLVAFPVTMDCTCWERPSFSKKIGNKMVASCQASYSWISVISNFVTLFAMPVSQRISC